MSALGDIEVEAPIELLVETLSLMVDQDERSQELDSLRRGFIDGLNSNESQAKPGTLPEWYGVGYRFGAELTDTLRWTHLMQADLDLKH